MRFEGITKLAAMDSIVAHFEASGMKVKIYILFYGIQLNIASVDSIPDNIPNNFISPPPVADGPLPWSQEGKEIIQ
jgi:hypothetical protein